MPANTSYVVRAGDYYLNHCGGDFRSRSTISVTLYDITYGFNGGAKRIGPKPHKGTKPIQHKPKKAKKVKVPKKGKTPKGGKTPVTGGPAGAKPVV